MQKYKNMTSGYLNRSLSSRQVKKTKIFLPGSQK